MKSVDLCAYLNFLFDQVKLQQEIRDRWFSYYMTISGAVSITGLTAVQFFYDRGFNFNLYLFFFVLSTVMFLIGICFFMIYIRQRYNYLKIYRIMESVEKKYLDNVYEELHMSLRIQKYGADFFTSWIHIIINSIFLSISSILLLLMLFGNQIRIMQILISLLVFGISVFCFEITRRKNFN